MNAITLLFTMTGMKPFERVRFMRDAGVDPKVAEALNDCFDAKNRLIDDGTEPGYVYTLGRKRAKPSK